MIKKTLYFGNPAYLSLCMGQMVIRLPEVETDNNLPEQIKKQVEVTKPVEDIGVVVLDNRRITITQGLIEALLENNCAVITCDSHSLPVGLMLPLYGNTTQNERFRDQLAASLPLKKQLWQQTIKTKISNQAAVLAACAGHKFLNYGYAILRAVVARALVSSGMLPTLGIHHHNRYNAYCLADDIMEPYRPYVDELVYSIVREYGADNLDLSRDLKARLLTIPTLDVMIGGKCSPLMVAVTQTTASLYKCFTGELRRIAYPLR